MILLLAILAVILPFILLYFNLSRYKPVLYLSGFFFLISLYGITQVIALHSQSVVMVSLVLVRFGFVSYLIGPMLYLYIRTVITDDFKLKKWDVIHLIPVTFWMINALPYLLSPFAYKLYVSAGFVEGRTLTGIFQTSLLTSLIPVDTLFLSRPGFILLYTFWAAGLLIEFIFNARHMEVFLKYHFMMRWLWTLIGVVLVMASAHFIIILQACLKQDLNIYYTTGFLQVICAASLVVLMVSPFFYPEILYGLPRKPKKPETIPALLTGTGIPPGEEEKSTLHFETDYLEEVGRKADECMERLQSFLQPGFNMARLSVLLDIPLHHLAYYFREIRKQSFNDYRNEWRIKYAKKLIADGKADGMTLEAIGSMSGFTSRNTFLHAFKRVEGVSPGVFASGLKKHLVGIPE